MTVKELRETLEELCYDDDIVILDSSNWFNPDADSEIVRVLSGIKNGAGQPSHTVVLQTATDIG